MNESSSDPSLSSQLGSLPVFLSNDPYVQPHRDSEDSRLSFPASVHTNAGGRGSYAATSSIGEIMLDRRDSMRGPPPPLPPKPPKLVEPGPFPSTTNAGWPSQQHFAGGSGPSLAAPQASNNRRPSEVLDLSMFAEQSPPHQHQPTFTASAHLNSHHSSTSPFPSASRTPSPSPFPGRNQTASPGPGQKKVAPGVPPRPQSTDPFPSFQLKTTPSNSSTNLPSLALNQEPQHGSPNLPPPPVEQISASVSGMSLSSTSSAGGALPPPPMHHARDASATAGSGKQSSGSTKLKDRLAAGVALGQSWAAQASKARQAAKAQQSLADSGLVAQTTTSPLTQPSPTPSGSDIKLPATILGVKVPKASGACFSRDLAPAVEATRVSKDGQGLVRSARERNDEVTGDEARDWLPGIAYRSLQFLEEWGRTEEGVYRVPGRSVLINQLKALYDAGCDLDLREIHPADLDPHAVASLFKAWLRDIPESLLSPTLEPAIDNLSLAAIGFTASSSSFLAAKPAPGGPAGLVDGRAPRPYLEQLRQLFSGEMPAEHFVLLRAIAYHLARLSSCSGTNKMTLNNFRLILSPTLRLSPVFLQILVEEREILFSGRNESIRQREGSLSRPALQGYTSPPLGGGSPRLGHGKNSSIYSSPVLGGSPSLGGATLTPPVSNPSSPHLGGGGSPSARSSPRMGGPAGYRKPPPSILPSLPSTTIETFSPGGQDEEWLVISDESGLPPSASSDSAFNVPGSPASSTGSRRTPIADRFASTFTSTDGIENEQPNRLSPSAASISSFSSEHGAQPSVPVKPYIPSRGASNPIGFYAKRDEPPSVIRKNSGGSANGSTSREPSAGGGLDPNAAVPRPAQGRERTASGSSNGSLGSATSRGRRVAVVSQMFRDGAELQADPDEEDPDAAEQLASLSPSNERSPQPGRERFYSESSAGGGEPSPSFASLYARQSVDSTYSEADTVADVEEATLGVRTKISLPSLNLPVGLGLAEREGEDDWGGLLSVQERRKLYEQQ